MESIPVVAINVPARLHIYKTDKFLADLYIGKTKINTIDESSFEYFPIETMEGQDVSVCLQKHKIIQNNRCIAEIENVFDNVLVLLVRLTKRPGFAQLVISGDDRKHYTLTELIPLSVLPPHLFDRRKYFYVRIYDDNSWMIVRYANLHQHTDASLLDGITKIKDLAQRTEWAAAVTDHGNMHSFNEWYHAAKKANKKPIIGCEVYVETIGGEPRPVLNLPDNDDTETRMFDNERTPVSTLAGEHMILLAKNDEGLHNLFQLVTHASEHFYRKPHVTWDLLEQYHEGIVATSACIAGTLGESIKQILKCEANSELPDAKSIKQANENIADQFITQMIKLFGKDDFYIELQNHHFPLETAIMDRIKEYAKKYGLKTTVGIDAHYLNKEDALVHEMWLCQQTKSKMSNPHHMKFSGDGYYVHTSDEVVELFPDDLDALDNTLEIAEKCNVNMESTGYHLPDYPLPEGHTSATEYLEYLTQRGFDHLWASGAFGVDVSSQRKSIYQTRIASELETIEKMRWETYFLVVQDFIHYAEDDNVASHLERYFPPQYYDLSKIPQNIIKDYPIYCGSGRGSAAGSLVCCCLGITKVDPIKYDLLFERFLSPDRVSMPDIDTDLEDSGREQVIEYCRVKYGRDSVARIVTFGTSAARNILKTVVRVNGEPVQLGVELASAVPSEPHITIKQAEQNNPDFKALEADPHKLQLINYAKQLEGLKSSRSMHACGVLMAPKPVVNYMPMVLLKNPQGDEKVWTTQLQGTECEEMGLLKMDFLGLITLGIAHEAINLIKKNHGIDIIYDNIPLDDVETYKYLADGNTQAVFQAESEIFTKTVTGVLADTDKQIAIAKASKNPKQALHELGEKLFMRVSDCNALVRPGPNQYVEQYTNNILGNPDDIQYDDPSMQSQLESTGGIMLYQEQVMLLTRTMAGFSAGQADAIRKAMGKKKKVILDEFKEYFVSGSYEHHIKGCVANGIPEDVARKVWNDMERFASYAFNKSHAVAYSMHTVRTAWLSLNYFPEYMTAALNANIKKPDKIRGYIPVIRAHNVKLLPPSINESEADFTTDGKTIRFGLAGLKGVGATSAAILAERQKNGEFKEYTDFLYRMAKCSKINKTSLSALIYAGCLDGFDKSSRAAKIQGIDAALKFIKASRSPKTKKEAALISLFESNQVSLQLDYDKDTPEMPKKELLAHEDEIVGFYMSGHPLDEYGSELDKDGTVRSISNIRSSFDVDDPEDSSSEEIILKDVKIAGIIKDSTKKFTKKGNPWWNLTVEDRTGQMKCTYFFRSGKDKLDEVLQLMSKGTLIEIQGKVTDSGYGPEMTIDYIALLSQYLSVTQAEIVELNIFENTEVTYYEYGKKLVRKTRDYVDRLLKLPDPNSRKKHGADIYYHMFTQDGIDLGKYYRGNRRVNLEQYTNLQYALGQDNVIPVFKTNIAASKKKE